MPERIRYDVEVDTSDATRSLRRLGTEGARAGKELADGLEDAGTAGERAGRLIVAMAQDADREVREAALAADALAQALGPELAAKVDTGQVVADLQKMGLTCDEVRADADQLATALRDIDTINTRNVSDGLGGISGKLDQVRTSGDQSRSVLANLAGNAAQDMGELGGVVGSLGVGIGQLAEYAVDGNIALSNLAKVAAPMLALALALESVKGHMQATAEAEAFDEQRAKDYADALADVGTGVDGINAKLQEQGELLTNVDTGWRTWVPFAGGREQEDFVAFLGTIGVTVQEVSDAIEGGQAGLDTFRQRLARLGLDAEQLDLVMSALAGEQEAYNDAVYQAEGASAFFASTLDTINNALGDQERSINGVASAWEILLGDMADGAVDTEDGASAFNYLRQELGLTEAELSEMAAERHADKIAEQQRNLEEALAEGQAQMAESAAAIADLADAFDAAQSRADGFAAAIDAVNAASELQEFTEIASVVDGLVGLSGALRDAADAGVDFATTDLVPDSWAEVASMPEELRPVVEAFAGLRDAIQAEMSEAFEAGGTAGLQQWAADMRAQVIAEIQAMGLDAEDEIAAIDQALKALGLTDQDIEITIRLANEAQARNVLEGLQGAIDNLPDEIQLQIAAKAATDPIGALRLAIEAFEAQGIEIPVEMVALLDTFETEVDQATEPRQAPIEAQPQGLRQADDELDDVARDRDAKIESSAPNAADTDKALNDVAAPRDTTITAALQQQIVAGMLVGAFLDYVARTRTAQIIAKADNAGAVNELLDYVARDRISDIWVRARTLGGSSVGGSAVPSSAMVGARGAEPATAGDGGGGGVAVLAAPTPVINQYFTTEVKAAVIGSPLEVQRRVAKAQRQAARLGQ